MAPRDWSRNYLLAFGGIFFVMSAQHLLTFFVQRADIWWTPKALSVPMEEASDRVEVYVRELPLSEQVRVGRLQLVSDLGATAVAGSDVRLRFNNWDRVRAQRLPFLLAAAVCAGASGVVLLLGILGWIPGRQPPSAQ